jgi:hypothetical protein
MKTKKFVVASMLVALMGLVAGCHSGDGDNRWSGYGDRGSYREGFRDGRTYQRRRDTGSGSAWGYRPYYDRYGYYRR